MRVTSLGVHAAFAVGRHTDAVPVAELRNLLGQIRKRPGERLDLEAELQRITQRFYQPRWQSNFLLEFQRPGKVRDNVYRLVLDCGGDIRHSLAGVGLKLSDIDAWYISHPHADHIGGIEGAALSSLFHPRYTEAKARLLGARPVTEYLCDMGLLPADCKPDLLGQASVLDELWTAAAPGLSTIQGVPQVQLETYFQPQYLKSNRNYTLNDGAGQWTYYTVVTTHVVAGRDLMPSYGLMFENGAQRLFFPTDTQLLMPPQVRYFYDHATTVYMDCETGPRSGVHPHIDELRDLPAELKQKMLLYHYTEEPKYETGEFLGTLRTGDVQEYQPAPVAARA